MKRDYFGSGVQYSYPKKVKHVAFITAMALGDLGDRVNEFADSHMEYKILGIKLTVVPKDDYELYVATVTYLCDAKNTNGIENMPYYDDRDPENDED